MKNEKGSIGEEEMSRAPSNANYWSSSSSPLSAQGHATMFLVVLPFISDLHWFSRAITKEPLMADLEKMNLIAGFVDARFVTVHYGILALLVKVQSMAEHVRLALAAIRKRMAVEAGDLLRVVAEGGPQV